MNRSVFVLSPSAESGKLLISLGLMQMLQRTTTSVAYFKPLIETRQERDNHIDTILTHFKINMEYDDAFAFSRSELSEMENQGKINEVYETIINKYKKLEEQFDFVLVEGSDFKEEGSVFESDFNASIAQSLAMPVLLVTKDSFATVNELVNNVVAESHSFAAKDINVIGLFVSRCTKDVKEVKSKIDKHIGRKIVVSVIPNEEELSKPTMQEIATHLKAHVLFGADRLENVAKASIIGGMQLANYLSRMPEDSVCVIPGDRGDLVVGTMLANISPKYPNVSGIVLSGGFIPERSIVNLMYDTQKPLPVLAVPTGTFETATNVAGIKPKIYPASHYKIKLCLNLFEHAVDTELLSQKINSVKTENITPRMFQYNMLVTAKKMQRHIVLPEGNDDRILTAASNLAKDKIVYLTILGEMDVIKARVVNLGLYWDDERIKIVNPKLSERYEDYYQTLRELRKSKGLELATAADLMLDVSYFGTMMVFKGEADGMVSGAVNTTAHTIKPALQFVKTRPGFNTVSSIFFMLLHDRVLVYGDCAIVPNPTAEQLAEIAISSADSAKAFGITTPKVAMLSYSSGASGSGAEVEKVRAATQIVKEKRPQLLEG